MPTKATSVTQGFVADGVVHEVGGRPQPVVAVPHRESGSLASADPNFEFKIVVGGSGFEPGPHGPEPECGSSRPLAFERLQFDLLTRRFSRPDVNRFPAGLLQEVLHDVRPASSSPRQAMNGIVGGHTESYACDSAYASTSTVGTSSDSKVTALFSVRWIPTTSRPLSPPSENSLGTSTIRESSSTGSDEYRLHRPCDRGGSWQLCNAQGASCDFILNWCRSAYLNSKGASWPRCKEGNIAIT